MILIGNYAVGAYKLFSLNENKVVISRYVQFDQRKGKSWLKVPNNSMYNGENSSNIRNVLQDNQVEKYV